MLPYTSIHCQLSIVNCIGNYTYKSGARFLAIARNDKKQQKKMAYKNKTVMQNLPKLGQSGICFLLQHAT
jgi:hypothetical protein